jgi:glycosyltransferase involved in cell wall biosynthesis
MVAIESELVRLEPPYEVMALIVLNGSTPDDERAVRAAAMAAVIPIEVMVLGDAGKNRALNAGIRWCADEGVEIVHVLDDDQTYASGSLKANVEALVQMQRELGVKGLVGCRHLVRYSEQPNLIERVAGLAFELRSDPPRFCIGGSMCCFVDLFPNLPDDDLGVADDAYICNWYFQKYLGYWKHFGFVPIVFPTGSNAYFSVARSISEYQRQQTRVRFGVLRSYKLFGDLESELRTYFDWTFHCDSTQQTFRSLSSGDRRIRWIAFYLLRRNVNRRAEELLRRGEVTQWNKAESTKHLAGSYDR